MRATSRAATLFMLAVFGGAGCHSETSTGLSTDKGAGRQVPAVTPGDVAASDRQSSADQDGSTDNSNQKPAARALFDGETLAGWEATNFGGEGEIEVANGVLRLAMGYPMTGVTSVHESLPTTDYEISLEAMRVDGTDFFCGLTFPVEASHCSLIVGGWGGTVVGLSSIDGMDAVNNETMRHIDFDNERWYRIRVRVQKEKISAWIDDELVIDTDVSGKELTVRNEVLPSCPLGICGFQSECAVRNVRLRNLADPSKEEAHSDAGDSSKPPNEKP
ncbi:MAG: DUF1080 domain-containing protein [Mariniblastus sp.]|nr:DUF1080 domain-containing protein [Mariniblastus sp.]